jgi:hypothetical protein
MFQIAGTIGDDADIWRLKYEFVRLVEMDMRSAGYVPRIDINPDFTLDYNNEKDHFEFSISIYGIYLGKKRSQWITGVDETQIIYTQRSKSEESLSAQVHPLREK